MERNPEPAQGRRSGVARALHAARDWILARPRNAGYAVVVAALLLTVPFGGLEAAEQEAIRQVPAGETADAAPWRITLEKAIHGPDLGSGFGPLEQGEHILILATLTTTDEVTETTGASVLSGSLAVTAEGVELLDGYGSPLREGGQIPLVGTLFTLEPTAQALSGVAPGLSYDVGIHLTTTDEVPDELRVELSTKTYRQSSVEEAMFWADETPSAVVMVPTEPSGPIFANPWALAP